MSQEPTNYREYQEQTERMAREEPWTWMQRIGRVPPRFIECRANVADFADLNVPEKPVSTYIFGAPGVGKTHLAVGLLAHWMPYLFEGGTPSFEWRSWWDVVFSLWVREPVGMDRLGPLLILDDVMRPLRPEVHCRLYQITNFRWERGLPIIYTSNWRLGEWDAFDSRLASRFGSGSVIEFSQETKDRRLVGGGERYQQLRPRQTKKEEKP